MQSATGSIASATGTEPRGPIGAIFLRIKTSCLATFSYGYFQASVLLFLPLYLIEKKGITKEQTILITAFPDERDRARAKAAGVLCYLAKPFAETELLGCIQLAFSGPGVTSGNPNH